MSRKVIFIDSVHLILKDRLEEMGFQCDWKIDLNRQEIEEIIDQYEGAVIRSKFKFDADILHKSSHLKWIARSGAGMENIDLDTAKSLNIQCFNSPEGNRDAVAEHCIGMLLSLFNHLSRGDQEVRQGLWLREKNRGIELKGKTVGLIGFGFMGQAFAQRLQSFGVTILAHDKYKTGFGSDLVKEATLKDLQEESDVISIHLPYTEETHYYVDEQFIANCQKPFYLINTARGKCLDTSALVKGINAQKVLGACLDVSEFESISFENLNKDQLPQAFQDLIASDKVILSPHVAGWTVESYEKLSSFLAEKILGNC